jgi:hypothetical protein
MTRRSRSSFDLRDALSRAESLSPKPPNVEERLPDFEGVALVAFGPQDPIASAPQSTVRQPVAVATTPSAALPSAPAGTSATSSLQARLSSLFEWVRRDNDVTRVVLVDDEGLPIVGDLADAESLLVATGTVASAMRKLALAAPGTLSSDFESHLGDGPVLQLIGLSVAGRAFVLGVARKQPFRAPDVDMIRTAFTTALATGGLPRSSRRPAGSSEDG